MPKSRRKIHLAKAQAAVDFLISWGWVIAIIVVAVMVLFYLGIFTTPKNQTLINGFQSLNVEQVGINGSLAVFQLTNNFGQAVTLDNILVIINGVTYQGSSLQCAASQLSPGQTTLCRVPVTLTTPNYQASVALEYTPVLSSTTLFSNGTVSGASISGGIPLNNQSTYFVESNLPIGAVWAVTLGTVTRTATVSSSSGSIISISEPFGTYIYNVSNSSLKNCVKFIPTPSGSSASSSSTIQISYNGTCTTTFSESGLIGTTTWGVSYNSTVHTASAPNAITYVWNLPISGISYTVNSLTNTTGGCTTNQIPAPTSGSANPGSSVSITFTPSTICTTTFIKPSPDVFNDLLNYSVTYNGETKYPAYTNYTNLSFSTTAGSHPYTAAMTIRGVTSKSGTTYLNNCTIPVSSGAAAIAGSVVNMSNLWVCGEAWYTRGVPVGHFWNLTYGGVYRTSTSKYLNVTTVGGGSLPLLSLTVYTLINSSNGCTTVYTPQPTSGEQPGIYGLNVIAYSPSTFCTAKFNDSNEGSPQHAWTVIYDGFSNSSTSTLVTFTLPLGNYSYSIQGWSGSGCNKEIYANQSTGWLTPGNTRVFSFVHLVSCGFTQTNFTESGLPKGYNWTVTYDGVKLYSTSNIISFNGGTGSFSYSVSSVTPTGCTNSYAPSPSSGSVTAGTSTAITFSGASTCTTTFTETGVTSGGGWTVIYNGTGQTVSYPTSSMTFTTPFSSAPYTFYDSGGGCPAPGLLTGSPSYGAILVGSTQAISFSPSSFSCI